MPHEQTTEQPFIKEAITWDDYVAAPTADPLTRPSSPPPVAKEFVNALVLNDDAEGLILEQKPALTTQIADWRVLHGWLEEEEDPISGVQRHLRDQCGYQSSRWYYLGSYRDTRDEELIGHLFLAQDARPDEAVAQSPPAAPPTSTVRWLPLQLLRYGLIDGRIGQSSCALTVSLALLTLLDVR